MFVGTEDEVFEVWMRGNPHSMIMRFDEMQSEGQIRLDVASKSAPRLLCIVLLTSRSNDENDNVQRRTVLSAFWVGRIFRHGSRIVLVYVWNGAFEVDPDIDHTIVSHARLGR